MESLLLCSAVYPEAGPIPGSDRLYLENLAADDVQPRHAEEIIQRRDCPAEGGGRSPVAGFGQHHAALRAEGVRPFYGHHCEGVGATDAGEDDEPGSRAFEAHGLEQPPAEADGGVGRVSKLDIHVCLLFSVLMTNKGYLVTLLNRIRPSGHLRSMGTMGSKCSSINSIFLASVVIAAQAVIFHFCADEKFNVYFEHIAELHYPQYGAI